MSSRTNTKVNIRNKPPSAMFAVVSGLFRGQWLNLLLVTGILLSAFTLIVMSHEQRQLYTELENQQQQRDQLDIQWRQLRLEQRVLAEHSRLEQLARNKLGMQNLDLTSERIVRLLVEGDAK